MLIKKKNPHGGDIYHHPEALDFSANINPFGMPEEVKRALTEAISECAAYPDPYCTALCEKLAETEGLPADRILCGNGAAELIYAFAYALPKEKPALILAPAFVEYAASLSAAEIRTEYFMLREEDGFRLTDEILKYDLSQYGAVFICSPNNPTGITAEPYLIEKIAQTGVRLFCDFTFLELTDTPKMYDIPTLIKTYPNLSILRAFTKSYAMAGVRLGYLLCSDDAFLSAMSEKVQCWNVSTLAQKAGIAALSCGAWLRDCVRSISAERKYMTEELQKLGIRVYPGEANFLFLHTEHSLVGKLRKRGIMVRDCSNYVFLTEGYIRIAVRTAGENRRLITAIREVLY